MQTIKELFNNLWSVVDKKTAKQIAFKAFKKHFKEFQKFAIKKNKTMAEIYNDWKWNEYRTRELLDDEGNLIKKKLQFVCHLSTWINGHRWEDEFFEPEIEEEDKWFNKSSGIIEVGQSLGIIFDEDKEPFPVFKAKVFKKYRQIYGNLESKANHEKSISTTH